MRITVSISPGAKKNMITGTMTDIFGRDVMQIKIAAPPQEGRANTVLIDFLADHYNVSRSQVNIISGHTARTKIVEIIK